MTEAWRVAPSPTGPDFMLGVALNWLNNKAVISQIPALFSAKSPIPLLGRSLNGHATRELVKAINERLSLIQYHSDPAGGTGDLYNHPEHTEWLLQRQGPNLTNPRDCDDFAVYAYALARKAGVQPQNVWIWNLLVKDQFRDVAWNHVILGLRCAEDPNKIIVLDTCSAAWHRPWEFTGTKWGVEAAVRKAFGEAYRDAATGQPRQYAWLVEVPPPFLM